MENVFKVGLNCAIALMMLLVVFTALPLGAGSETMQFSDLYDENNRLLKVSTNKMYYKPGEEMAITIYNGADFAIGFETDPKFVIKDMDGNIVYPTSPIKRPMRQDQMSLNAELSASSWNLAAGAKEMYRWDQATITLPELSGGLYSIETVSDLPVAQEGITFIFIREKGYVVLVAGNNNDDKQDRIDEACNQIYDDLMSIGYAPGDVYYLNGWDNYRVDDIASSDTVEDAIKVWAADKVTFTDPLFLILFDHGGNDHFCIDNDVVGNDNVFANELSDWMSDLQEDTNTEVFMWYMGCHSGSFIDEVSGDNRIIITSSRATENSGTAPAPYHEKLSSRYWPAIKDGDSLGEAFDTGSHYVAEDLGSYHPLLDDDGDGVGHGWDTPDPSGYLPHDGDGFYADNVYMGGPMLAMPFFNDIVAAQAFRWPVPPEEIILDVEIIMELKVVEVIASMRLPESAANYDGNFLVDNPYVDFQMTDPDKDGTWSVNIPTSVLLNYFMRPGEIQFIINAKDDKGQTAMPGTASVEFTQDGSPSPDTTPPDLRIRSPEPQGIIDGMGVLSAVASDDSCLDKVEIYINNDLIDTVDLPESSSAYFEYERDTSELPDGVYTLTVMVYDLAGNTYSKSIELTVLNNPAGPSPILMKLEAITILEDAKIGDKKLDRMVDDAIGLIRESLNPDHWHDEWHLDPQHGHKSIRREKIAVLDLWHIYSDPITPEQLRTSSLNAIMLLLEADHALARTICREAGKYAGDESVDRELYSSDSAFEAAAMGMTDDNSNTETKYFKAIDLYQKAWHHGQLAMS